jgi:hypothetical protein
MLLAVSNPLLFAERYPSVNALGGEQSVEALGGEMSIR